MSILVKEFHNKNVRCTVVGDGDGLKEAKRISSELEMNQFIYFTGYIYDRKKISELMEEMDICIEPAPDNEANRHSTFIKIMEYMAAKKAIVAFNLEENRTTAGKTAILVEPGNLYGLAKAIDCLIKDPLERKRLGQAAYERILNKLNWENSSKELVKSYQSVYDAGCSHTILFDNSKK
jgi:glycosyltransferase involved in cell wall biosynthesis